MIISPWGLFWENKGDVDYKSQWCVCGISSCVCHGWNVQSVRKQCQDCLSPFPDQCFNTRGLSGCALCSVDLTHDHSLFFFLLSNKNMISGLQRYNFPMSSGSDCSQERRLFAQLLFPCSATNGDLKISAHEGNLHERLWLHCYCWAVQNSNFPPQTGPRGRAVLLLLLAVLAFCWFPGYTKDIRGQKEDGWFSQWSSQAMKSFEKNVSTHRAWILPWPAISQKCSVSMCLLSANIWHGFQGSATRVVKWQVEIQMTRHSLPRTITVHSYVHV